jgi:glycosyltransferase involved in cell wall biosynthesis
MDPSIGTLAVIPAYNEEEALPAVVAELRTALPWLDVLVVSDGSTDATADVARAAGVRIIELPYNLGIGGALQTGFRYAAKAGYQRVIQFDADGQHDPSQVGVLLDAIDGGADLVIGSRFGGDGAYEVGRTRRGAMALMRLGIQLLTGVRFSDTSSGFRAFSGRMTASFAERYPTEYLDSVEALLQAVRGGFRVLEVPVTMRTRLAGEASNRNLRLAYHFVRLGVVMLSGAGGHNVPAAPASS